MQITGERSRFQLFGDTMNTTSRLESTSKPDKIQTSKETAELLIRAGRESWLVKRDEIVNAKGLGEIETYWIKVHGDNSRSSTASRSSDDSTEAFNQPTPVKSTPDKSIFDARTRRLIDWNVDTLLQLLKQIVAQRYACTGRESYQRRKMSKDFQKIAGSEIPLDEVKDIIYLPAFDINSAAKQQDPDSIVIPEKVVQELVSLVSVIASLYRNNPFHNFDHAR